MKKLLLVFFVAMFCMSANADTVGPYEVKLKQKVLASIALHEPVHVTLEADSIAQADTIYISRVNCPGAERPVRYIVLVLDSTHIYKRDEFDSRHTETIPYKVPLAAIISDHKATGSRDYFVQLYYYSRDGGTIMGDIHIHLE